MKKFREHLTEAGIEPWFKNFPTPAQEGKRYVYVAGLALKKIMGKPFKEENIQAPDQFKGQVWQYFTFDTERGYHEMKIVWKPRKSREKGSTTWGIWLELYDGENQYEINRPADFKKAIDHWGLGPRKKK